MTFNTTPFVAAMPRAMSATMGGFHPMLQGASVAFSPDEGALSIDQAAGLLSAAPVEDTPAPEEAPAGEPEAVEEPAAEEAAETTESEAEPTAEDTPDPDADPVIAEAEDPESESDPQPVIAAPKSWDASERALFAQLPAPAQEVILKRETERDRAVSKAQQEAGEARKSVETELSSLAQYKTVFDQVVTNAKQVFAGKWDRVDWVAWAEQDPEAYTVGWARFNAEQQELNNAVLAQQEAEKLHKEAGKTEFQNYVRSEFAKLPDVAPDLADLKDGKARRIKVAQFLLDQGAHTTEDIERISAVEMSLAYDAMRFREGKAALRSATVKPAAPAPKPAPPRAAAPTAAAQAAPPRQRQVEIARANLNKTGSIDDAVALLLARGK